MTTNEETGSVPFLAMGTNGGWAPGLVVILALGGCLSGDGLDTTGTTGGDGPPATAWGLPTYACPGGDVEGDGTRPCVGAISSPTESANEPDVALHPDDPDTLAIGVNGGRSTTLLDPTRAAPGVDVARLEVYVSTDGGASWTHRPLPHLPTPGTTPAETAASGDPSIMFDDDGVLHVTGIASRHYDTTGYGIIYVASADLGATWRDPILLTADADNDRNWLTAHGGILYVVWQNVGRGGGESTEAAWSLDGGHTWSTLAAPVDGCAGPSPVRPIEGVPHFTCTTFEGPDDTGVRLMRLDIENGTADRVSEHAGMTVRFSRLTVTASGSLVVVGFDANRRTALAAASTDGGRTWSPPADLGAFLQEDTQWYETEPYAVEADPWGHVHVVLRGAVVTGVRGQGIATSGGNLHLVLDDDLTPLTQTRIEPPQEAGVPSSLAPTLSDHFGEIAFHGALGLMAWGDGDASIHYTFLHPSAP